MTEVQEQAVLIGDRQLAEHTDRSRTTVRDWHQRPYNALPFTINEKGYKVFRIAEVDIWLNSSERDDSNYSELGALKQQVLKLKIENRELTEKLSELETTKAPGKCNQSPAETIELDNVGQFVEARETVRGLMRESFPNATDKDLSQNDSAVVNFFNKVQSHLKLDADNAQTQSATGGR